MENLEKIKQIKNPEEALNSLKNKETLSVVELKKIPFTLEKADIKGTENLCFNINNIYDNYLAFSTLLKQKEKNPIGLNEQLA